MWREAGRNARADKKSARMAGASCSPERRASAQDLAATADDRQVDELRAAVVGGGKADPKAPEIKVSQAVQGVDVLLAREVAPAPAQCLYDQSGVEVALDTVVGVVAVLGALASFQNVVLFYCAFNERITFV